MKIGNGLIAAAVVNIFEFSKPFVLPIFLGAADSMV